MAGAASAAFVRAAPVCAAAAAALAIPLAAPRAASPEENRTVNLNYVYASNLGFGGYSIGGLTADVFTLPLAYRFPAGVDGWTLRVSLPVQLGLYEFSATDTNGQHISLNQQSLAVVPGIELLVPVGAGIAVKPFISGGAGYAFGVQGGVPAAWIYTVGLRSVMERHAGPYTLSLGAAALYAGDSPIGSGFHEAYSALELGFEVRRALGFSVGHVAPDLGIFVSGYHYPRPLEFSRFLQSPLSVSDQAEIGFSIGSAKPFEMLWMQNPRIGAGFVFGDGLRVWHVTFGFPF